MTLSVPQVHALLDHICTRCAGSHSFLSAVKHGTTLTRTESFLETGPAKLLQSFFNRLPDHQIDIERGSTHPTDLETEVSHFSKMLQTCLVDVTLNPSLMLDFTCGVEGVPTIDLMGDEVEVRLLSHEGNIAEDVEEDAEMSSALPDTSTEQGTAHAGSSTAPVPPGDEQQFSPQHIERLEALMSKENKALRLKGDRGGLDPL